MKFLIIIVTIVCLHLGSAQFNFTNLLNNLQISFNDLSLPENFDPIDVNRFVGFDATLFDGKHYNPFSFNIDNILRRYERQFNRRYSSAERPERRRNLRTSLRSIASHILYSFNNGSTYNAGLNGLSDRSEQEFRQLLGTAVPEFDQYSIAINGTSLVKRAVSECLSNSNARLPSALDYRNQNMVTPVKMQSDCGSCWAFATLATIESQWAKQTKQMIDLSEQNLINCASSRGCGGETLNNGYEFVVNNGVHQESDIPYKAKVETCRHYPLKGGVQISSYCYKWDPTWSTTGQGIADEDIMRDVRDVGPVAVVLNADRLQSYSSGVFDIPDCPDNGNHAVVIVGWGSERRAKYWIVKNSWDTSWGEKGFFRIVRARNMCTINDWLYYPTLTNAITVDRLS